MMRHFEGGGACPELFCRPCCSYQPAEVSAVSPQRLTGPLSLRPYNQICPVPGTVRAPAVVEGKSVSVGSDLRPMRGFRCASPGSTVPGPWKSCTQLKIPPAKADPHDCTSRYVRLWIFCSRRSFSIRREIQTGSILTASVFIKY